MSFATLDGGFRLFFESTGHGPPVVLLHGLGGSHAYWDDQVPTLANRYRTIVLDIRGHGRSDKPPGPYSVPQFAADTLALLDQLGIRRAAIVGLSMGGGIAQTLAIQHPDRVGALGLVSTGSTFPPEVRARFRWRADVAERDGMAPLVDSMMAIWFTPPFLEQSPRRAWIRQLTLDNDPMAFAAACRANAVREWTAQLPRITCPTLFVGGAEDPADPAANAALYRQSLADVETHVLPGVSHLLNIQAPDALNAILLAFLGRVEHRLDAPAEAPSA